MKYDYRTLQVLAAVAENHGFEAAGDALGLSQSAVSQRIKTLEEQLGQTLVVRSSPPTLTPMGERLMAHQRRVKLLEEELETELNPGSGYQAITIGVNADSLATWFLAALTPTAKANRWLLSLKVGNEDLTQKMIAAGQVVGSVTSLAKPLAGCISEKLGIMRYQLVASPEYVAEHFPQGVTRQALQQAPGAVFNDDDFLLDIYLKRHFRLCQSDIPCQMLPSAHAFMDGALMGLSFSLVPETQAAPYIEGGQLVNLCPDLWIDVPLYWQCWAIQAEAMKAFTRELLHQARESLRQS